jgi:hypothetical protein
MRTVAQLEANFHRQSGRGGRLPWPSVEERHRRLVVRVISAIYWLLIFEGVLRKWVAPQWGRQLFFVRDPLVILVYFLVFVKRTRLPRSGFLEVGCGLAIAGLGLAFLHGLGNPKMPAYILVYGWRNYFLYMPLAFIIARYFDLWDLAQLARRTLMVSIPIALLLLIQTRAPANAPINAGLGEGPDAAYLVNTSAYGVVRAQGPFTSDLGLSAFSASSLAIALAFWVLPARSRPLGRPLLLVSTASILLCLGLSGSRGVLLWSTLMISGAFFGLFLVRPEMHFRATALILTLVGVGVTALPILFPRVTTAFVTRWIHADMEESRRYGQGGVLRRAYRDFLLFRVVLPSTPPVGYGLGSAGNAAWRLGIRTELIPFKNQDEIDAAESDWGRNILELGPLFGCLYILFRISFAAWLARSAVAATRRSGHSFPWLLCVYVAVMLLGEQITGNGTINGYAWLFAGFCMAATWRARRFEERLP